MKMKLKKICYTEKNWNIHWLMLYYLMSEFMKYGSILFKAEILSIEISWP